MTNITKARKKPNMEYANRIRRIRALEQRFLRLELQRGTLQLDYTPIGDRCVICNADAYTCEHLEDAEREARLDAQAEYEDQIRYEREAMND